MHLNCLNVRLDRYNTRPLVACLRPRRLPGVPAPSGKQNGLDESTRRGSPRRRKEQHGIAIGSSSLRRRLGRRRPVDGHAVRRGDGARGQRLRDVPRLSGRDSRAGRHDVRRVRISDPSRRAADHDRRRRAAGARRVQSGGFEGQSAAARARRADRSERRQLHEPQSREGRATRRIRAGAARSTAIRSSRSTSRSATLDATAEFGLSKSDAGRCKNFWALGLVQWMFNRDVAPIEDWITKKFAKDATMRDANLAALRAGHAYGETAELSGRACRTSRPIDGAVPAGGVPRRSRQRGARARFGGRRRARRPQGHVLLVSDHARLAAAASSSRVTGISASACSRRRTRSRPCAPRSAPRTAARSASRRAPGPGIALKTEAIGLAINAELPLVVVNSQRGGPSTGLPTKTEQSDLYQAVYGRNADAPVPGARRAQPERLFRGRDRGRAHRVAAHDAGDSADRRLPRERRGAVAHCRTSTRSRASQSNQPAARRRARMIGAVIFDRDPETLGRPWVSPRHAGPDAPRSAASRRTSARATSRTTRRTIRR